MILNLRETKPHHFILTLITSVGNFNLHFSSDFSVGDLEGVKVDLHGLGLLNWVAKKVILVEVEQNITNILMASGKEVFKREFKEVHFMDLMYLSFKIL